MGMMPSNAQPIVDARKRGLKPSELILVSLVGVINEKNHTVYAKPKTDYTWFWVRGIKVCVYTLPDVEWRPVVRSIAFERPSYLAIWDVANQEGADVHLFPNPDDVVKPQSEWRWQLDYLPWLACENEAFAWN